MLRLLQNLMHNLASYVVVLHIYRAFSHDVTAAILVYQENPLGV